MSCWRVLPLPESPDSSQIPQFLVKPDFRPERYTVFVTDLGNIWSEELELNDILGRALQQDSPIEVSAQDTSQLSILLDHVKQSLTSKGDSVCRITKGGEGGIVLQTTTSLPKPLGSLQWSFQLRKRTPATLKNELILPLLVSSHIQHERVNGLLSIIRDKDRSITRFVDQFESSNLDLALAFPSIAGLKTGRRQVKREQAARHIPALRPFQEEDWRRETAQLDDGHVSTLGLFQEALSQCNPKVPSEMKSDDVDGAWWASIRSSIEDSNDAKVQKQKKPSPVPKALPTADDEDETETDDDFEISEDLKRRLAEKNRSVTRETTPVTKNKLQVDRDEDTETEDDDLDARPKSRSQSHSQSQRSTTTKKSPDNELSDLRSPSPKAVAPSPKKPGGFRIGGAKAKKTDTPDLDEEMPEVSTPTRARDAAEDGPPKPRKTFKIGGKGKSSMQQGDVTLSADSSPKASRSRRETITEHTPATDVNTEKLPSRAPAQSQDDAAEKEEHEETAEEKAERRRLELKRKNEELARRQAHKKKKRF